MTFEKLTYSGNDCNNYLYYSFDAEYFDTETITRSLNIKPTSVKNKRDPVPVSTSWVYKVEVGNGIDLETPLEKLIDLLLPKVEIINRLKQQYNLTTRLQFVIDIDINPDASTPYFGLSNKAIDFLYRTGTDVDFDVYKADTLGIFIDNDS